MMKRIQTFHFYRITLAFLCFVCILCRSAHGDTLYTGANSHLKITIEISVIEVIRNMAIDAKDPILCKALNKTIERQKKKDKDVVTLLSESFTQVNPKVNLAAIFNSFENRDRITATSTNKEVLMLLREKTEQVINGTLKILHARLDSLGIVYADFRKISQNNRYLIECKDVQQPERIRKLLCSSAKLEFWETYKASDVFPFLFEATKKLAAMKTLPFPRKGGTNSGITPDLFGYLIPSVDKTTGTPNNGSSIGYALIEDTAVINKMFKLTKELFPRDLTFVWGFKSKSEDKNLVELVALRISTRDGIAPLGGDYVIDAHNEISRSGQVFISISMNPEGTRIWKRMTAYNVGNDIAIVIDGLVYSHPQIMDQIPNGKSSISGHFTKEEWQDFANMLKSGMLQASVKIVHEESVDL